VDSLVWENEERFGIARIRVFLLFHISCFFRFVLSSSISHVSSN
jgi:hypothetical protein